MAGICLVLTAPTLEENAREVQRYRSYIDYLELRVDLLDERELSRIHEFPGTVDLPVICTIRRISDGGTYSGSESERIALFRSVVGKGFAYVDFESDFHDDPENDANESKGEIQALREAFVAEGTVIIRSLHDFGGVPQDLDSLYRNLTKNPGEIPKIAVYPKCFDDAARLYAASRSWGDGHRIVLGMGTYGFFTRILATKLGSLFTFTSPAGTSAAPGHIDPATLCDIYRYGSIRESTRIYCVIADPVMHSRSPWIHNPALDALDFDGVYVPIHVDNPETFFSQWRQLDIDGASVTIPHKEQVIPLLRSADDAVRSIGSCNTVVPSADGTLSGSNTDVPGFLAAVADLFPDGRLPAQALVVGAGGTARSIVYALTHAGVDVMIVNRTEERAHALAEKYGCTWGALGSESEERMRDYSELIVQTTNAGMSPDDHIDPIEFFTLSGDEAVFDVVYAPKKTKLLLRAEKAGCRIMNGWRMLLEQAYVQFLTFTGNEYPEYVVIPEPVD